ncbi:hypothetical protein CGZ93_10605 [Enemella dayhoffiae]|uniref:Uncharacterized protein n=1 Tax=Enemella dayhoffiae TaxID=2016507 RepID=A0A255H1V2_9ACTN|nr:hypothetical protein CGZ93_10605 [Enemella dayhoffiae]
MAVVGGRLGAVIALAALVGASLVGIVGAQAAVPQGCDRATDQIRAVTINAKSLPLMSADKVSADVTRASRIGGDVLMWQRSPRTTTRGTSASSGSRTRGVGDGGTSTQTWQIRSLYAWAVTRAGSASRRGGS